jgi:hypothetical protein
MVEEKYQSHLVRYISYERVNSSLTKTLDVPRSGYKTCCEPACPSFRAHLSGNTVLSPVVDGGWFNQVANIPEALEVPLNSDYFNPRSNEVYLVCSQGHG